MADPYLIHGPALISYSGGRTSAYMLKHIIDAHGGTLPEDVIVTFANTGKERKETLDFVDRCAREWGVRVVWLEYRDKAVDGVGFEVVSHNMAARNGEPFNALLRSKQYLPNPVMRFCTIELKIRTMRDYCQQVMGWKHWTNVIGLRHDEPGRVGSAKDRGESGKEPFRSICPLDDAKVTEDMVLEYWRGMSFDLGIQGFEGNCDLCFLKGAKKLTRIMQERPDLAGWWIEAEAEGYSKTKADGCRFRADRPSYAQMSDFAARQGLMDFGIFDDHTTCSTACTD